MGEDLCWWGCVKMTHYVWHTHTNKHTSAHRQNLLTFIFLFLPPPSLSLSFSLNLLLSLTLLAGDAVLPPRPVSRAPLTRLAGLWSVTTESHQPLMQRVGGDTHGIIHKIWAPFTSPGLFLTTLKAMRRRQHLKYAEMVSSALCKEEWLRLEHKNWADAAQKSKRFELHCVICHLPLQ